ncbi:MAG: FG-GAP-like repeat-containing protein, partial [Saprospiraceae bacterium]
NGTAAGTEFLAYMAPPGNEGNVINPFTGTNDLTKSTHLYIFAKDSANVTVVDAGTNGQVISRTYAIAAGRYIDCALNLAEWKSIYNGDGNPNSGPDRPYLLVTSDSEVGVYNTNFNDNWMAYYGTSKKQDFSIGGTVTDPSFGFINDCFNIGDTAIVQNQLTFNNTQYDLVNPTVEVRVPDGAVVLYSKLEDITTNQVYIGSINIHPVSGLTTITFTGLSDFTPSNTYEIETGLTLAINHYNGQLITDRTLLTAETIISGTFDGEFQQTTEATGVLICNDISLPENIVTPEANTWSVAWGDYNNDCYPDLFIANYDSAEANILYKNNGDGTFSEVFVSLFANDTTSSTVGTWGDYDNDGDLDLFVANNIGSGNYLYRNENNGQSFTRIYNDPIVNDLGYAHGATWVDYDNDGFLDMFTAEFFATRFNNLYKNNGDGTFTKNTTAAITLDAASSVAGVWGDYDNDGDQDLFVANTNNENNFLYRNDGNGNFTKITTGAIVNDGGQSVGASWGDYDSDNDLDLFVANSGQQNNFLYTNNGDGTFTKVTTGAIVNDGGHSHGSSWADVNNDGWLDLFVANDQNSVNYLYMNNADGTFSKMDHRLSLFTTGGGNSFGSAFADFDNDGDLDLFVANHANQGNVLIQNYSQASSNANFINIKLTGTNSNASAIGAHIELKATINGTPTWLVREVSGLTGGGIGGQNDLRVHFGLGDASVIDSIIVTWPSGFKQIETNVTINQGCYAITEIAGGTVSGTVFHDINKNGTQESNEPGIPGITVLVQETGMNLVTDDNGYYEVVLNTGTYTLQQFPGANWSQFLPSLNGNLTVNVTQIGADYPNNDFADTASCLNPDLVVELNTTALRVGFENVYAITYRNIGTTEATNVNLSVDFGQYVIPINANLPWDNVSGTTYTWNLGTVTMGEAFTIIIADSVSTNATIGDMITVTGSITSNENECNATDNQAIDINEAVGAIDPNDITAYPGAFISYDQELTYRIRFQNVGNTVANRVIVRTELPENLDIETLLRGQVSHPAIFSIEDERTLVWDFQNINLIDSTTNEEESHGFIWFKAMPIAGIQSGETIENFATIFFDNAEPIVTNTAKVTITGSQETGSLSIFPNPVGNTPVTLKLEDVDFDSDERIEMVQIYDVRGVLVHVENGFDNKQVELLPLDLPTGQYFIEAYSNEGNRFVGKMMKK